MKSYFTISKYYTLKQLEMKSKGNTDITRLDGKTVIITGANTGIGKETAIDLASRGARIILACRDQKKADDAASEIKSVSGNENVVVELLDLASLDSVRQFAKRINQNEPYVNILVNNAGLFGAGRKLTKDGFEMNFGVNHLGHFLLTNLLLDKLKASAPSRIVNVSSDAYKMGRIHWDDIMLEKSFGTWAAYAQSKFANVLFTRELAKRLPQGVTAYALHPGAVKTDIGNNFKAHYGTPAKILEFMLQPIFFFVFKSAKQGAKTTIFCCVDEQLGSSSGKFYADCQEKQLLSHALKDDEALKLWELSDELVKNFR